MNRAAAEAAQPRARAVMCKGRLLWVALVGGFRLGACGAASAGKDFTTEHTEHTEAEI